jgi:hypothetical protein
MNYDYVQVVIGMVAEWRTLSLWTYYQDLSKEAGVQGYNSVNIGGTNTSHVTKWL